MMAVNFRCEKCGKSLKGEPGVPMQCPHCRRKVAVPAGLASLPRPRVLPTAADPVANGRGGQLVAEMPAIGAMAGIMPWVLSVFLHLGLFLIMLFVVMFSARPDTPTPQMAEIFRLPPQMGRMAGFDDPRERTDAKERSKERPQTRRRGQRKEGIDPGITRKRVILLGGERSGLAGREELGWNGRSKRGGPRFIGKTLGAGVRNVVYVVDRSGSMADSFEGIKMEILRSIGQLEPHHSFHVILFGDNKVIEGPRRRLIPGDDPGKLAAQRFLKEKRAIGPTTALVALKRAFAVLKHADRNRPGKLIYLLSDGDFGGITGGSRYQPAGGRVLDGNQAVLQWLRDHNKKGEILINTFLLDSTDRVAVDVLGTIARENGGEFKHISPDEHP